MNAIWLFVAFFLGAIFTSACQVSVEKKAVEDGYMKINGKLYTITPLDIGGKKE
jgi:hypothetical protein